MWTVDVYAFGPTGPVGAACINTMFKKVYAKVLRRNVVLQIMDYGIFDPFMRLAHTASELPECAKLPVGQVPILCLFHVDVSQDISSRPTSSPPPPPSP
jgi:hypothetical protein